MRTPLAGLWLLLMLPAPAIAQERTPESAQQVLAEVFAQSSVPLQHSDDGILWQSEPTLAPTNLGAADPCITTYSVAADRFPRAWPWTTMTPSEQQGDRIIFDDRISFQFTDEETASRITVAMEFLRSACASSGGTGF